MYAIQSIQMSIKYQQSDILHTETVQGKGRNPLNRKHTDTKILGTRCLVLYICFSPCWQLK